MASSIARIDREHVCFESSLAHKWVHIHSDGANLPRHRSALQNAELTLAFTFGQDTELCMHDDRTADTIIPSRISYGLAKPHPLTGYNYHFDLSLSHLD
jgi:hypothetical protein